MYLFQISLFIGVIILIRACMLHSLPKKTFLALWLIAAFRLLVPLKASSPFSIYTIIQVIKSLLAPNIGNDSTKQFALSSPQTTMTGVNAAKATSLSSSYLSPVLIIWGMGACLIALYFVITYMIYLKEYRMSLPVEHTYVNQWLINHPLKRKIRVLKNDRIQTPLTYGILNPVILLPRDIDSMKDEQLRYILTHEMTHIRHFDTLSKLILTICVCIYWFHPLVWIMYILANRDIELCCDEAVVLTFSQNVKSSYAYTLIDLAGACQFTPFVNNFSKNSIEERIVSIMKTKKATQFKILLAILFIIGLPILFTTNALTVKGSNEATTTANTTSNSADTLPPTIEELSSEYGKFGIWFDLMELCIFMIQLFVIFMMGSIWVEALHLFDMNI